MTPAKPAHKIKQLNQSSQPIAARWRNPALLTVATRHSSKNRNEKVDGYKDKMSKCGKNESIYNYSEMIGISGVFCIFAP